jgi:hypothetical protein
MIRLNVWASIDGHSVRYYPPDSCLATLGPVCAELKRKIYLLVNPMPMKLISLVALVSLVWVVLSGETRQFEAQAQKASYAVAAPISQYFIADKSSEIELARSAAPASIASGAEVLVLAQDGYTSTGKGENGFVCLIERSWAKTTDDPEFWNPKVRAPICVNAPAARTYLPLVLLKTKLVLAGKTKMEIAQALKSALDRKELPALEPNAMCYMMSRQQYLRDNDMHWHPHMMWFIPGDSVKSWGTDLPGVPGYAGNVPEDRMTVFMLPVDHWSDSTPTMP